MLDADWDAAKAHFDAVDLRIREKELAQFTSSHAIVAKQAAFFTLVAYSAITMTPRWMSDADGGRPRRFFLYTFLSITIGFNMLSMVICSWCMIFGPGLAIRGPPGSMARAISGMHSEERVVHVTFAMGIIFLVLSAITLAFTKLDVSVLAARVAEEIVEEGLNGRTTIHDDPLMSEYCVNGRTTLAAIAHSHKPLACAVVMLGTNDLKAHLNLNPHQVARGAGVVAGDLLKIAPRVLLVAPPVVYEKEDWGFVGAHAKSKALGPLYAEEARALGCDFLDASKVISIPDPEVLLQGDGIHLSPQNARDRGEAIAAKLMDDMHVCTPRSLN
ncbi:hypothetical protein CTAYLR_000916 [Chrysophaeum taylorii]|uniref:SGNH hydrolase-type esterase domain-containing protein n=1 Tax=Chrysophaeum taylorii TaxID=2483200 RepID=A0AAD7UH89_9STRA|nr:hypothetical protein CTAYLR_000916 [Chrysophaeum taylorii]